MYQCTTHIQSTLLIKTLSTCKDALPLPGKNNVYYIRQHVINGKFIDTSNSILLNSSKHAQQPAWARPLKNFPIALKSSPSEQLKTTH